MVLEGLTALEKMSASWRRDLSCADPKVANSAPDVVMCESSLVQQRLWHPLRRFWAFCRFVEKMQRYL